MFFFRFWFRSLNVFIENGLGRRARRRGRRPQPSDKKETARTEGGTENETSNTPEILPLSSRSLGRLQRAEERLCAVQAGRQPARPTPRRLETISVWDNLEAALPINCTTLSGLLFPPSDGAPRKKRKEKLAVAKFCRPRPRRRLGLACRRSAQPRAPLLQVGVATPSNA